MWQRRKTSHVYLPASWIIVGLIAFVSVGKTDAASVGGAVAQLQAPVYMVLEASVNHMPSGVLLTVVRDTDGRFLAYARELRTLRIKLDASLVDGALVSLATLPGLDVRYDEQQQAIDLLVPDALLEPYVLGLGGQRRVTDLSLIGSTPGLVVNYGLYGVTGSATRSYLSGNVEAIAMTAHGNYATTALYNSQRGYGENDDRRTVRLDSVWRQVDPVAVRSYAAGDFNSGALGWTSAIRMAGVQVQSAFRQRADLVSWAMPQFSGSAALPSTLDMYVNNIKVFTGQVPAGPFSLQALPFVNGGEVKIVTTDSNGQQVEVSRPYYAAAGLLRQGLTEYSLEAGLPRRNYGMTSFDYDHIMVGSGAVRYGLADRVTLEGVSQFSSDGLHLGGVGSGLALGGYGVLTMAGSISDYHGLSGKHGKAQVDMQVKGIRAYAGSERASRNFFDLARVALYREGLRNDVWNVDNPLSQWMDLTARASAIDRLGMSFQPWFDRATSINLAYTRVQSTSAHVRTVSLSLSRRLAQNVQAYVTAFRDLENGSNHGVYATLNFSLGGNTRATISVEKSDARTSFSQQVSGNNGTGQGRLDWLLGNRDDRDGGGWRTASIGYQSAFADMRVQADQSTETRVSMQINGALVAAGGDVFAANRIGDAFAIVRNAGAGSEIRQNGMRVASANQQGNALLSQLQPYSEVTISMDPTDLPLGWEPEVTQRVVAAAWKQGTIVDFGARPSRGAILVLQDMTGQPIAVGARVRLRDSDHEAVVGHGGEAYLTGLMPDNRIDVQQVGAHCHAAFSYVTDDHALPRIGPLICR